MEDIVKYLEDMGIKFVVGWREKERKRKMSLAMEKIKESKDEKKIKYAKALEVYDDIFDFIGDIINPDIPLEEDKYGLNYLCSYLDGIIATAKKSIAAVIIALGNDEKVDPFCKELMFTHMYTPEQVKEIGHEEIYRRQQKFIEEELSTDTDTETPEKVKELV